MEERRISIVTTSYICPKKTYELGNDYLLAFSVRLIKMIPISHSLQSIISKESGRNVKRLFSSIKIS